MRIGSLVHRSFLSHFFNSLGLLAAGQSSTMTGTYAGQFVMEGKFFSVIARGSETRNFLRFYEMRFDFLFISRTNTFQVLFN
jgi:Mn2+/Fe2+ NRAMP family transporter